MKLYSHIVTFYIVATLLSTQICFSQQYDFAIYNDNDVGAWEEGIVAFEQFLDWKGITHNRVDALEINTSTLKDTYSGIYFPGGWAYNYKTDINPDGIANIRDLVADSGAYIGICAGAYFACDTVVWNGISYNYPLKLYDGKSIGPINELAIWPNYAITTLSMNAGNEINQFEPPTEDMLYYGGSWFMPYFSATDNTVATYDSFFDKTAITNFTYGNGRVLLIGTHPEIEEDLDRDSTDFAQELNDNGSDWNFLWSATDWVLNLPITSPNAQFEGEIPANKTEISIFPNPTSQFINIYLNEGIKGETLSIFNMNGKQIFQSTFKESIDVSGFPKGMYFVKIKSGSKYYNSRFLRNE